MSLFNIYGPSQSSKSKFTSARPCALGTAQAAGADLGTGVQLLLWDR